jgi:hypothetical protein
MTPRHTKTHQDTPRHTKTHQDTHQDTDQPANEIQNEFLRTFSKVSSGIVFFQNTFFQGFFWNFQPGLPWAELSGRFSGSAVQLVERAFLQTSRSTPGLPWAESS